MENNKIAGSKLFVHSTVDFRDELEEKYERAHQFLQTTIVGLSDKEFHDTLQSLVCKHDKHHEDISLGLVYMMLTEPTTAPKTYRDLTLITRDGLAFVINNLSVLVVEKYQKLSDIAKKQLIWLLRELVKNQVQTVDNLVWNVLRQASGGDTSPRNLALIEGLLDIFIDHRPWLDNVPIIISQIIYTYVRLLEDHSAVQLTALRNKEVKFIISLIRERFLEVIALGRDFIRILQNVARIPEFEALWKEILLTPKKLHPQFSGIWQILQTRTSRRFLQCRLTPDMERKLIFLTNNVKFGHQKRYQDWFQDRYFTTPESHSLRSDLIRFIINAIHPTNDMLCSDIIPRWAIIGWLLTSCTNTVALANAKLAIFYDWLFFDPQKDNIMNVEPGILVMFHSIKNHPMVSTTLLDFLCRIMKNFYPRGEERIKAGVYNSLRKILEKQVIPNLQPLFESQKLDKDLKSLIRETFRDFFILYPNVPEHLQDVPIDGAPKETWNDRLFGHSNHVTSHFVAGGGMSLQKHDSFGSDGSVDAKFSDDEDETPVEPPVKSLEDDTDDDDIPLSKVRLKEKPDKMEKIDLPNSIQKSFDKLMASKSIADFESFLTDFRTSNVTMDSDQETYLFNSVTALMRATLPADKSIYPESKNDEKLSESINFPLFSLFKVMYQYEEKCKKCILDLLMATHNRMPNTTGYMLFYFLKVYAKLQSRKSQNSSLVFKTNVYKLYCDTIREELATQLTADIAALEQYSSTMFLWLLPDIYREFKDQMVNNSEVLRTVVGCVDAKNLRDLVYNVTQGKLVIFKNEGILDVVKDSLSYETFEQFCVWQLIQAHDVPMEFLQDLIPELESANHAEALTNMLMLLKYEAPTTELIRLLMSRETKHRGDPFVTSALRYWCIEHEERCSEIIASLLTSKYPINSPNKRKRPLKSATNTGSSPSSEQLLNHLEHFRRSCRHGNGTGTGLYVQDAMQRALQQAFSHSSDSQKKQFSDLFGLAAEDETSGTVSRRGTSSRGRKAAPGKKDSSATTNSSNNKKSQEPINNYSSEESSDEDWSKQKPSSKRRKKALSDSD
uniref:SOSS complex subunit A homolog n=1 Tax=Culicoides sonorensis TaxID=179676 RepID=A0A336LPS8_CULSO